MISPSVAGKSKIAIAATAILSPVGARRYVRSSLEPQLGLSGAAGWALSFGSITLPCPYVPASLEPPPDFPGPAGEIARYAFPATGCRTVVCPCIAHDPYPRQH